jgi:O-antigen/teichoic acid export membrane protein
LIVHAPTASQWSFVYLITTMAGAAIGLLWVQLRIGAPHPSLRDIRKEFAEGISFSVSLSAQSIYNDIDKTMLARMSTLDAVGIYAAAYRIIDVAFIPVRSLLNAAYPGFFRAGQAGLASAVDYLRRLLPKAAGYTFAAFFCILAAAPVVPHLFGRDFGRTVEALRLLALLPLLKALHYFLADTLTCTGHQRLRSLIQVIVAGFNILLNLWLIPNYSWRGAAWSSVATDGLLALTMYAALRFLAAKPVRDLATSTSTA